MRALALLLALGLAAGACAGPGDAGALTGEAARSTAFGPETVEKHALMVFVRFRDDTAEHNRGWPREADLPPLATTLLAESADRILASDSSLSRYFWDQSKLSPDAAPRFVLTGEVHPRDRRGRPIAYVPRHDNAHYHRDGVGYAGLVREVLDYLFEERGLDPAHFDRDGDGLLDHLFLVTRSDAAHIGRGGSVSFDGAADMRGYSTLRTRAQERDTLRYASRSRRAPVTVDWIESGSIATMHSAGNLSPQVFLVRLLAHEIGHDLWRPVGVPVHFTAIPQTGLPTEGDARIGYTLMEGSGRTNAGGTYTLSGYERALQGWAEPVRLERDTTVALRDLYSTGDVATLALGGYTLWLANRQRVSYFDRLRTDPNRPRPYDTVQLGLQDTGLQVLLAEDATPRRIAMVPADGTLELGIWFGDRENPYASDLFGPEDRQLSPWTRPGIHGCLTPAEPACARRPAVWSVLDDFRLDGTTLAFDFVADARTADRLVIRRASWMGPETDGATFTGRVHVAAPAVLTVESGTEVTFAGGLTVDPAARLVVEPGATVHRP